MNPFVSWQDCVIDGNLYCIQIPSQMVFVLDIEIFDLIVVHLFTVLSVVALLIQLLLTWSAFYFY